MDKVLNFIFDMKNILSLNAAVVFSYLTVTGKLDAQDAFTIILMVFTFFLGSKVKKV